MWPERRERERDTLQEEIKGESMGREGYAVKPRVTGKREFYCDKRLEWKKKLGRKHVQSNLLQYFQTCFLRFLSS
jgi:hypothetical protein